MHKKDPIEKLEKNRGLFFLIGLALAGGLAVYILEMQFPYVEAVPPENPRVESGIVTIDIPRTKRAMDEPAAIKKTEKAAPDPKAEPKKLSPKISPSAKPKANLRNLATVGQEPDGEWEDDAPVTIMEVSEVARPQACAEVRGFEEQMNCLNDWLRAYLASHAKFPEISRRTMMNDQRIYVEFVIDQFGRVESATIPRGGDPALEAEALRVIKSMPRFIPASQMHHPVKMRMTIPVNFRLE